MLLRGHVKNGKVKTVAPYTLWRETPQYQKYSEDKLRQKIYQEQRAQRYINYLNDKRMKNRRKEEDLLKEQLQDNQSPYMRMTIEELKDKLRRLDLPVSGRKAALINRLEEADVWAGS